GAVGVSAAYSLSMVGMTLVALFASRTVGILQHGGSILTRSIQAGTVTAAAALVLAVAGVTHPALAAVAVLAVAIASALRFGLREPVVAAIRGTGDDRQDAGHPAVSGTSGGGT
ncbi:MAG: hypothetical protein ACRDFR_04775, partial [Candidatus Limnocylindria bacterium]